MVVPRVSPVTSPRASGVPPGAAEPGQRGHEVDAAGVARRSRRAPRVSAADPTSTEPVAQPLHRRAAREHRALERVAVGRGRLQETVAAAGSRRRRCGRARSCRSRTSPCPRPARGSPGRRAPPAGRRRCRGSRRVRPFSSPCPIESAEPTMRGSSSRGTPNSASSSSSQSSVSRLDEQRPRRVRHVDHVLLASGQPPDEEAVDGAEREPVARAVLAQQPFELRRREVRVGNEPRLAADELGVELAAALGRAPVLPDDRRRDGLARSRGPRAASSRAGS